MIKATFDAATTSPYEAEIRRAEERVLVDRLTWLAATANNGQVRAVASLRLQKLAARLRGGASGGADPGGHASPQGPRQNYPPPAAALTQRANQLA